MAGGAPPTAPGATSWSCRPTPTAPDAARCDDPGSPLRTPPTTRWARPRSSSHELHMLCYLLLGAGNETTRNLITHGLLGLTRNPAQQERLREGRDLKLAVEELLRWVSPLVHQARTVTTDAEVAGCHLAPGDQVVMLYGAANRDERVFGETAEELDVTRDPNPHLAFGFGEHFCLGAALARVEARVLFDELVDRLGHWSVVGPDERLRSTMIRGIKRLPVVLAP
ncbi:cytochrome P450 [Actinomadura sp. NPDC047616]|uniref:cytochrome P450 n=1 Tax=Actinomadura sp. NPDC047616 TaxID=3155914 RepID=UPI0033E1959D